MRELGLFILQMLATDSCIWWHNKNKQLLSFVVKHLSLLTFWFWCLKTSLPNQLWQQRMQARSLGLASCCYLFKDRYSSLILSIREIYLGSCYIKTAVCTLIVLKNFAISVSDKMTKINNMLLWHAYMFMHACTHARMHTRTHTHTQLHTHAHTHTL